MNRRKLRKKKDFSRENLHAEEREKTVEETAVESGGGEVKNGSETEAAEKKSMEERGDAKVRIVEEDRKAS